MSTKPAAKRRAFAKVIAAMEREAGRSQTYALELYGGTAGLELLAAEDQADRLAIARAIGRLLDLAL